MPKRPAFEALNRIYMEKSKSNSLKSRKSQALKACKCLKNMRPEYVHFRCSCLMFTDLVMPSYRDVFKIKSIIAPDKSGHPVIIFLICPWKHVVGTHLKRLSEAHLMSTHNICFQGEMRISILFDWKVIIWSYKLSGYGNICWYCLCALCFCAGILVIICYTVISLLMFCFVMNWLNKKW